MIPRLHVTQELRVGDEIPAEDRAQHYLRNVMRRAAGDPVVLFNGRDGEFRAEIARSDKRTVTLKVVAKRREQDQVPDLWLCFAPLKKDATDFLIEKGYDKVYGARQMKRTIQKYVEDALAEELLRGNIKEGENVTLGSAGDKLTFVPGTSKSASPAAV